MGFKAQVLVNGVWTSNEAIWPDMASAEAAGADLYRRWTATSDYRGMAVEDKPNRPTFEAWVSQRLHADSLIDHLAPTDSANDDV